MSTAPPEKRTGRRRRSILIIAAAVVVALGLTAAAVVADRGDREQTAPVAAPSTPPAGDCGGTRPARVDGGPAWECSWSDEFEGTQLADTWSLIPYGLGSACLFDDPEFVQVRDGELNLVAKPLPATHWCTTEWGLRYGGGGIQTGGAFSQRYGRFEMRAQLPPGAGFWPAFWLLPDDETYSGEIDVLETYGGRDNTGDVTLHVPANGPGPQTTCAIEPDPSVGFHTYTMDWEPGRIRVWFDDRLCADFTGFSDEGTSPPGLPAEFDVPYHVMVNLAVQPWWPPDENTPFPGVMRVDYVRVWH